jgi:hypothetical protein
MVGSGMVDRCLTMGLASLPFGSEGRVFLQLFSFLHQAAVFSSSFRLRVNQPMIPRCVRKETGWRAVFSAPGIGISGRGGLWAGNDRADSIERVGFASGLDSWRRNAQKAAGKDVQGKTAE